MRFVLRRILRKPEPVKVEPPEPTVTGRTISPEVSDWGVFATYARVQGDTTRYHFNPNWFVDVRLYEEFREAFFNRQVIQQHLVFRGYEVKAGVVEGPFGSGEFIVHDYGRLDRQAALAVLRHYYILAPITGDRIPDAFNPSTRRL